MCFIASAFFGLDQVGVVLESPFGARSMLEVPARWCHSSLGLVLLAPGCAARSGRSGAAPGIMGG